VIVSKRAREQYARALAPKIVTRNFFAANFDSGWIVIETHIPVGMQVINKRDATL
jgi:hypothetical protein